MDAINIDQKLAAQKASHFFHGRKFQQATAGLNIDGAVARLSLYPTGVPTERLELEIRYSFDWYHLEAELHVDGSGQRASRIRLSEPTLECALISLRRFLTADTRPPDWYREDPRLKRLRECLATALDGYRKH